MDHDYCSVEGESKNDGKFEEPWDGGTKLKVGNVFNTRKQVKEFVSVYEKANLCKFSITDGGCSETSKGKKIVFSCVHGLERRPSKATSLRPLQHTKKLGCPVFLRFFCRGNKTERQICVLKGFDVKHNHPQTADIYKQETDKIKESSELSAVKDAVNLKSSAGQIKNLMKLKFNKNVTVDHVRYIMSQLKGPENEKSDLACFLGKIVDDDGIVQPMFDSNGFVRVLAVQS